jgi:transcriptional repressor NrdR
MLVEDVMDAMEAQFEKEIPSSAIGEGVMQRLRTVDQVAYVRFASVYKEFRDVAEFVDEISTLAKPKAKTTE